MWKEVTEKDQALLEKYLNGLKGVREHYRKRIDKGEINTDTIKAFIKGKDQFEAWIYEGKGFSTGLCFCYKNGLGHHAMIHSWSIGKDKDIKNIIDIQSKKGVEYLKRHKGSIISHKKPRESDLDGINSKITEKIVLPILKKHFKEVTVGGEGERTIISKL